jgi:hypothetical protein
MSEIHNRHNSSINLLERWTNDWSTFGTRSARGTAGRWHRDPLTITGNLVANYGIAINWQLSCRLCIVGDPITGYGRYFIK